MGEETADTSNELQPLAPRHHDALMAYLECGSIPATAETVGVDRTTVWRWLQREDVLAQMKAIQDAAARVVRTYLAWNSPKMARRVVSIAGSAGESKDDAALSGVELRASLGGLDRAGLSAVQKHEVDVGRRADQLSPERIRELEEAARADLARGALVGPGGDGDDEG